MNFALSARPRRELTAVDQALCIWLIEPSAGGVVWIGGRSDRRGFRGLVATFLFSGAKLKAFSGSGAKGV